MAVSLCKRCGYRWNHPTKTPAYCPSCKTPDWDKENEMGDVCEITGCKCDLCGCEFFTGILQAHHCPNCGSKDWDKGKMPNESACRMNRHWFRCTKCGHEWMSKTEKKPRGCPRCHTRKIQEVIKDENTRLQRHD